MKPLLTLALALALATGVEAALFGPKGDDNAGKRANIRQQRDEMLNELLNVNPELKNVLPRAAGYATFSQISVNLLMLATANGYGVLVDNKARTETFMRMASLGGGVGAGVKDVRVIIIFHDPQVMRRFVEEGWQFGGQADTAAKYQDLGVSAEQNVKAGVSFREGRVSAGSSTDLRAGTEKSDTTGAVVTTRGGMELYQFTESGIALQATVAGTKYWRDSKLNN
ncbi:MAG: hypothetical protein AB9869_09410 [Verrucomicrobiia bacterium]